MIVLGMVGTPAGGKSTAAEILAEFGAEWINADLIARQCLNEPEVVKTLVDRFGTQIVGADGAVDRAAVADLVFGNDPVKRGNLKFLESLIHPRTRVEINRRIVSAAGGVGIVVLLDIPLLFESGWDRGCDAIWCVDATRANRLARSRSRGWDAAELDRRESNQMPIETKCRLSNLVMRNDSTLDALRQNLRCHWDDLVRMDGRSRVKTVANTPRHCLSDH